MGVRVHLEAWGASTWLEKSNVVSAIRSAMENVGISSATGAAVVRLALVAEFGLLSLLVLWKCASRSRTIKRETPEVTPEVRFDEGEGENNGKTDKTDRPDGDTPGMVHTGEPMSL